MATLEQRLGNAFLGVDGVMEGASTFGPGAGFWVHGKQMGEDLGDGRVQIRLTRPVIREHRDRLRSDDRVELRGSSDWLTVTVRRQSDVALVAELVELAAARYRPASGVPLRPPPTGAELERRRRWH